MCSVSRLLQFSFHSEIPHNHAWKAWSCISKVVVKQQWDIFWVITAFPFEGSVWYNRNDILRIAWSIYEVKPNLRGWLAGKCKEVGQVILMLNGVCVCVQKCTSAMCKLKFHESRSNMWFAELLRAFAATVRMFLWCCVGRLMVMTKTDDATCLHATCQCFPQVNATALYYHAAILLPPRHTLISCHHISLYAAAFRLFAVIALTFSALYMPLITATTTFTACLCCLLTSWIWLLSHERIVSKQRRI